MKYACLVYGDEKAMQAFPVEECVAYCEQIEASGHYLGGEALQPTDTATTIQVRGGSVSTTDGPFAETREQLAGFYLIEARDLNEAIRIASRIPPARIGSIEIRPVRDLIPQSSSAAIAEARPKKHLMRLKPHNLKPAFERKRIMTTATPQTSTPTSAEAEIRDLVNSYVNAIGAADVARICAHHAPDILAFDAIGQLRFKDAPAYRAHWEACMAMCPSQGMTFELHEPGILVNGDLALGHWLCRCGPGPDETGETKTGWMRATLAFRKTEGRWAIVHEHWSVPFNPETGQAEFHLQP